MNISTTITGGFDGKIRAADTQASRAKLLHSSNYSTRPSRIKTLCAAALFAAAPLAGAAEEGAVVVSFKPLHSLVQGVMGDSGKAVLLVGRGESAHGFHPRPSQVRALHRAEVVFYVHNEFETFLAPLEITAEKMPLGPTTPVRLVSREGHEEHEDEHRGHGHEEEGHDGHDEHHGHDHEEEEHKGHDEHGEHDSHAEHDERGGHEGHAHEAGATDWHIWMDIDNAAAMVREISDQLSARYPHNRAVYAQNSAALLRRLHRLDEEVAAQLKPVRTQPYAVLHDAYQYMEKRYGLRQPAALLLSPHLSPSAKRLRAARRQLEEQNIRCVFLEPQFSDRVINAVAGERALRVMYLDPLGSELPAGEELYFSLMRGLAATMAGCLTPSNAAH